MSATRIYLGTVTVGDGEAVAFSIPRDYSPEEITAALEAANLERLKAAADESRKLREMFLPESGAAKPEDNPDDE